MKIKLISPKTTGTFLAFASLSLSLPALAIPITGVISFSGTTAIDSATFATATRFTEFQDVTVGAASSLTGSYAGTSGAAVAVTPFIWSPPTGSTPITPLWSFVSGGDTYSFDLTTLQVEFSSSTGLLLTGLGTAHITGPGLAYTDTSGLWDFSAQTEDFASFTFSSSTTIPVAVPEGGTTVALLGAVLLGLGLVGRKHIHAKVC